MVEIRVKSLRKLIEICEFLKEEFEKDEICKSFRDYVMYYAEPTLIASKFRMSDRTAYDYLEALRSIVDLLSDDDRQRLPVMSGCDV
jgi:hypothetical protein